VKVFLDTNVLISAFTARGLSAELFRYLLAEHEVLTGEVNLLELRRVLRDRFGAAPEQIAEVEAQLRDQTVVPKPATRSALPIRDPDDAWVLASALAGESAMLVTGDKDLLAVAKVAPLPILTPRDAWEWLRGGPGATA
jgi:putative PIN family toxin of toxin-antitoxin system